MNIVLLLLTNKCTIFDVNTSSLLIMQGTHNFKIMKTVSALHLFLLLHSFIHFSQLLKKKNFNYKIGIAYSSLNC